MKNEYDVKEQFLRALFLDSIGYGAKKISKITGVHSSTIHNWIRGVNFPPCLYTDSQLKKLNKSKGRTGSSHHFFGKTGASHPAYGLKRSEKTKRLISLSKRRNKNPNWKGKDALKGTGRYRARSWYPAPQGHDHHHIDGNPLNNDPTNVIILTRKEHMKADGRLDQRDNNGKFCSLPLLLQVVREHDRRRTR